MDGVSDSRLVLVRHGETVGNSHIRYFGRTDLALADKGRAQMRAVRAALSARSEHFAAIFTSPLVRARESAAIVAGRDAELIEIPEFAEVDFGDFEGLTAEEIRQRFPLESTRWERDKLAPSFTYPGGENRAAFTARVTRGLGRMLAMIDNLINATVTPSTTFLTVAHRGVVRVITERLAGISPVIELGSIQILERHEQGGAWHVAALDLTDHLANLP